MSEILEWWYIREEEVDLLWKRKSNYPISDEWEMLLTYQIETTYWYFRKIETIELQLIIKKKIETRIETIKIRTIKIFKQIKEDFIR